MMLATRHLCIHGDVQGVGYRASLTREARRRGLVGWVRNRADGSVEAVVHGEDRAVGELIEWARRGPPSANVAHVEVEQADDDSMHRNAKFEQRPTA